MVCTLMITCYWIINDDEKSIQNVYFICNIKIANRSINLVTRQLGDQEFGKSKHKTFLNILFFKGFKIFWLVNQ